MPDGFTDEQVLLCQDSWSTGLAGAKTASVETGDTVAVCARGTMALCATAGAGLRGAKPIIAVASVTERLATAERPGVDDVPVFERSDLVEVIVAPTSGRGIAAAIEASRPQTAFAGCRRVLEPAGMLSGPGCRSHDLGMPPAASEGGLGVGDMTRAPGPGGKQRMWRATNVRLGYRLDLGPLVTHPLALAEIEATRHHSPSRRDAAPEVAIAARSMASPAPLASDAGGSVRRLVGGRRRVGVAAGLGAVVAAGKGTGHEDGSQDEDRAPQPHPVPECSSLGRTERIHDAVSFPGLVGGTVTGAALPNGASPCRHHRVDSDAPDSVPRCERPACPRIRTANDEAGSGDPQRASRRRPR